MNGKLATALIAATALAALSACGTRTFPTNRDYIVEMINDGAAVKILDYRGGSTDVRIPSRIYGRPVTAIGSSAFARRNLTSVSIPNTVTYIGDAAFWLNRLSDVSIPRNVSHIGYSAFGRNHIDFVSIPSSVTYIGARAFDEHVRKTGDVIFTRH